MDINLLLVIVLALYSFYIYNKLNIIQNENIFLKHAKSEYENTNNELLSQLDKITGILEERENTQETFVDVIGFNVQNALNHKKEREMCELDYQYKESTRKDITKNLNETMEEIHDTTRDKTTIKAPPSDYDTLFI